MHGPRKVILALVAAAVMGGAAPASAQQIEWQPTQPVIVPCAGYCPGWVRNPRRYLYVTPRVQVVPPVTTVRVVRPPPQPVVVHVQQPPPPQVIIRNPEPEPVWEDPYDTDGIVVLGAGMGAVASFRDGEVYFAPGYRLNIGLALGQAEFGLRFDFVPNAMEVASPTGEHVDASLYTAGAAFGYRLIPRAVVHPVVGIGLETIFLNPDDGESGTAFAGTARLGLEFAYPVSGGAIAAGIDVAAHQPFGATQSYGGDLAPMLTFGAYANYRF